MNASTHYMIVKQSDLYPASHFRSGLFFASLVLMLVYFLPFHWQDPIWLLYIEVCAFFVGYLLAYHRKLKRFFTFKGEMKEEVHQKALESMREYGIAGKSNTIFLFASQTEKCVTCILSPDLEEREEDRKIQRIIKKTLKEKKLQFKNNLNRGLIEALAHEIRGVFGPDQLDNKTVDVISSPQESSLETKPSAQAEVSDATSEGPKTLDQENSPETPTLAQETNQDPSEADKTELKEENQTPEV